MEAQTGVEPAISTYEADVMPFHHRAEITVAQGVADMQPLEQDFSTSTEIAQDDQEQGDDAESCENPPDDYGQTARAGVLSGSENPGVEGGERRWHDVS